ncbi:hydrolase [Roseibium polysiphoniae]|uniref:Hydrolase n=1 Tax=Roseibium polysiphoniae TaxID=2571221 RepID=A0A944CDW0_9HYPH|nr:carbon-nitrogen hydrolase family protein [Roseibium polysiphoniae]MBS8260762.1 hydrolase [Roseibium polysiphoniae]
MKIAVCQMDAAISDREERFSVIERSAGEASEEGARILVFPELAVTGYGAGEVIASSAESLKDSPVLARLSDLVKNLGLAMVVGVALKQADHVFNAAVFLTPDGSRSAYSKVQLYGAYEKGLFQPGDAPSLIVEFEGLKLGFLVCFDVEFPERTRDLAMRGADLVLVPTALPKSSAGAFIAGSVVPVRAFESQIFIAYANHCGADQHFAYQGSSCIAAPDGALLASASINAELIFANIEPQAYEHSREQNPYLDELVILDPA